jgi:hypothetical protein
VTITLICQCLLFYSKFQPFFSRYKFSVESPYSKSPSWSLTKNGDEFDYLFGRPVATLKNQGGLSTLKDVEISKFVMQSWSNFVKTG